MTPPAVLLSSRITWDAPTYWRETLSWLTDVQTADNDTECRASLRSKPRRTIEYTAKAVNAREAALLGNLVWGNQPVKMGIPVWADVCTLTAPIIAGATAATLDTTYGGTVNREFVNAGFVGFWTDPFTCEVQTLSGVTPPGTIAMSATTNAYPAGTAVFPVTVGTLSSAEKQQRKSGAVNEIAIVAACDVLADTAMVAAATWSGSQFNGADCLSVPFHNWRELPGTVYHRTMLLEDSVTGIFGYYNPNAAPVPVRDFLWTNLTRAAIAQMKGFLANRLGRYTTFYCPTWVQDFVLANPVLTTDTTLTVQSCGYSLYVFPADAVRRTLVLMTPLAFVPVTVNGAIDNGNGTETLTLNTAVGTAFASGLATQVSYLTPVRLDRDAITIEYKTGGIADTRLTLAEVPLGGSVLAEVPLGGGIAPMVVTVPTGVFLESIVPALAGPLAAGLGSIAFKMRFRVDELKNLAASTGLALACTGIERTQGVQTASWTSAANASTDGAGNFILQASSAIGLVGNSASVPQSSLPALGTYIVVYCQYDTTAASGNYFEPYLLSIEADLYTDAGILLATASFSQDDSPFPTNPAALSFYVGFSQGLGSNPTGGLIVDWIALYSALLTGTQRYSTPTPTDGDLLGLWPFDGSLAPLGPSSALPGIMNPFTFGVGGTGPKVGAAAPTFTPGGQVIL